MVFTVTQINNLARNHLEQKFSRVTVVGEISNYKLHSSGHHYFSLKDRTSQVPAVFFRSDAARNKLRLRDGMEVLVTGGLTLFPKLGRFQLRVEKIELRGAGALQAAFEELKRRLHAEGLFAAERKRPLPRLPRRVAVITSPQGAVIRDIIHVAVRRYPQARVLLVPCPTQGAECARPLAWALARVARLHQQLAIDVVVLARGGGSLEDLWGFNEEVTARAIAASPIPVVSAVGHETDFTIADFVADQRAPTPSAAAELIFPLRSELEAQLTTPVLHMVRSLHRRVEWERRRLMSSRARLGDGKRPTREAAQRLMELEHRLERGARRSLQASRRRHTSLAGRIRQRDPKAQLGAWRHRLAQAHWHLVNGLKVRVREHRGRQITPQQLGVSMLRKVHTDRQRLAQLSARLHALSPLQVLARGYAIVEGPRGVLRDAAEVTSGDPLQIRVAKGTVKARVE